VRVPIAHIDVRLELLLITLSCVLSSVSSNLENVNVIETPLLLELDIILTLLVESSVGVSFPSP